MSEIDISSDVAGAMEIPLGHPLRKGEENFAALTFEKERGNPVCPHFLKGGWGNLESFVNMVIAR